MLVDPFSLDALPSISMTEARLRSQLATSSLFVAMRALLEVERARGTKVSLGRLDLLRSAIVERMSRTDDAWHLVTATDVGVEVLVHADARATDAVVAALGAVAHVHISPLPTQTARERLKGTNELALLPVELVVEGKSAQLRVFFFPHAPYTAPRSLRALLAEKIDVRIALVCAFTWLSARDLGSLIEGDALSLDVVLERASLVGRLLGRAPDLDLVVTEDAIVYEGRAPRPRAPNLHLEGTMSSEDTPLDGWADIDVELTIDIGTVTMPLTELATLAPGSVLVPKSDATDRVTVRANGRAIARGTLVRVEGQLAVRIDALAPSPRALAPQ